MVDVPVWTSGPRKSFSCDENDMQYTYTLPASSGLPSLFVRQRRPDISATHAPVLYVHGGTFPSGLSLFFPFDGYSWADDLAANGFDG